MVNHDIAAFMDSFQHEALTFNDVSLELHYADFMPAEASTATRFSRNITLNIENGCRGKPAGVCRVRIYEVDGTLPAMKIPQTTRPASAGS